MVFKGKISAEKKAFVKFLREEGNLSIKEIVHWCGISRATIYHCLKGRILCQKNTKTHGRPRIINEREERLLQRTVTRLCKQQGNFSCHRVRAESGLYNVSLWTINRMLKRMGYAFLEARKKKEYC